jgi:hypothetical protein
MPKDIRSELFGGEDSPDSVSSIPAEPDERIKGSDLPEGAASDPKSASGFEYEEDIEQALESKVETYNENFEDPDERNDEVTVNQVRAVFRRGMGAFSDSHNPNASRRSWGFGRVNEFLERSANKDEDAGFEVDDDYTQDDDLLPRGLPGSTLEDDEVADSNGPDLR